MRSALAVFSLSIKPPHSAVILSSSLAAIAARQGAGSTRGTVSDSLLAAKAMRETVAHNKTAPLKKTSFLPGRMPFPEDCFATPGAMRRPGATIHIEFAARLRPIPARTHRRDIRLDDIRMDHRSATRRCGTVGAGATDRSTLSDLSCGRRCAAGHRALEPLL